MILFLQGEIWGQGSSQSPCGGGFTMDSPFCDVTYASQNWDWEVPYENRDLYCKTWMSRIGPLGSPWDNPGSGKLNAIVNQNHRDYTKAKGWQLLKREFGCTRSLSTPYFVLYNKYTGLIRVFVFLNAFDGATGFVVTMRSLDKASPVASCAQSILKSPDTYRDNKVQPQEDISVYIPDMLGRNNWAVAEFQTMFDPYNKDQRYNDAGLQFHILSVQSESTKITLDGKELLSGFGFNGKDSEIKTSKPGEIGTLNTAGKAITTFVSGMDNLRTTVKSAAKGMEGEEGQLKTLVSDFDKLINGDNTFSKILSTVSGLTGAGGQIFKFVGAVSGMLSPSSTNVKILSTGKSQGSITTKFLDQFIIRLPGVNNGITNLPYYDCPLGITNIANKPVIEYAEIKRRVYHANVLYSQTTGQVYDMNYELFKTYKGASNIEIKLNQSAGVEIVSAQAALVAEVRHDSLFKIHYGLLGTYEARKPGFLYINHMLGDLESGITILNHLDPGKDEKGNSNGTHNVQTPWVDISCFGNSSFTVFKNCKVYVAVKVILRQPGAQNDPIVFINYYEAKMNENKDFKYSEQSNKIWDENNSEQVTSASSIAPFGTMPQLSIISSIEIKGKTTEDKYANSDIYTNGQIRLASDASLKFVTSGRIDFDTPKEEDNPGAENDKFFEVEYGATFEAYIEGRAPDVSCQESIMFEVIGGSCGFNNQAHRMGDVEDGNAKILSQAMTVFPNPTKDKFTLKFNFEEKENPAIAVYDMLGNKVTDIPPNQIIKGSLDIDLSEKPSGMYWIRLNINGKTYTEKIILSK